MWKEMFVLYIDPILYGVIFSLTIMVLKYFKIDINYIYVIIFSLIIFIVCKMALKRFVHSKKEEIDK